MAEYKREIGISVALAVALALVVGSVSIYYFPNPSGLSNNPGGGSIPPYPPWLNSTSNEVSISQLAAAYSAHNLTLELPSWIPSGYGLTSVHVPDPTNPYGYAVIAYSAHGITDPLRAEIAFQVIPGNQPSQTELEDAVTNSNGSFQLLTVAAMPVLLNPEAQNGDPALQAQFGSMLYAQFWKGGIYYQARAYRPLTDTDLLAMIGSLQPVH